MAPKLTKLRAVLADLDIYLANEHELLAITAVNAVKPALARLRPFYAGHIVIKLGPRGALWVPAGTTAPIHTAARSVKAINTVGAGDTFNGALLAALDCGRAFPAALFFAHAAAASVVSSPLGVLGLSTPRCQQESLGCRKSPTTRRLPAADARARGQRVCRSAVIPRNPGHL